MGSLTSHRRSLVVVGVEDAPAPEDVALLEDGVATFTLQATGGDAPRTLTVFARVDGAVVGGVYGWTWGRCCELVSFWVHESWRGQGVGRELLTVAEAEARSRDCRQVVLFTHAEQAPGFYRSAGYELVGHVDEYPAGSAAFWFRKSLDPRPGLRIEQLLRAGVWLGIVSLVVAEMLDTLRWAQRRAVSSLGARIDHLERRERDAARRAQAAALVVGRKGRRT